MVNEKIKVWLKIRTFKELKTRKLIFNFWVYKMNDFSDVSPHLNPLPASINAGRGNSKGLALQCSKKYFLLGVKHREM